MKSKRINRNSFRMTVEENRIKVQDRIQTYAFYFICFSMLTIVFGEIYKMSLISDNYMIIYLIAHLFLVIVAMIMFLISRKLFFPQRILFVIVLSFMFTVFSRGGGEYSIVVFYFLVAFPVFIMLFDNSLLIIISVSYIFGMVYMLQIIEIHPTSIFSADAIRYRFYPVLFFGNLVAILTSIGFHKLIKTLSLLAFTDGVCNFSNRERFIHLLKNYITHNKSQRFSVIGIRIRSFFDLETQLDFNVINDLLVEVSKRINKFDFVCKCRWSNATFLTILELNSLGNSKEVVHSLLRKLEEVYELSDYRWTLHFQIGVTTYPDNTKEPDMLISNVLSNLNKSPMEHGNIIYDDDSLLDEKYIRYSLVNVFKGEEYNKEFSLMYTPIVELGSDRIVAAEVKIHWNSMGQGQHSTSKLLKFAEDRGFIRDITRWIIDIVFREVSMNSSDLFYYIHISILDLKDITFIPHIITLTQKYSIDPVNINFIIPGEILVDQDELLVNSLTRLHNMNFSLTLNNFGYGYSSLESFLTLPINQIMIHKRFIDQIQSGSEETGQKVIKGIISLSDINNLQVIAKGVKNITQRNFLINNRCHYGQGDLFNREMSFRDLQLFISTQS